MDGESNGSPGFGNDQGFTVTVTVTVTALLLLLLLAFGTTVHSQ
jgi:hypothetical protein